MFRFLKEMTPEKMPELHIDGSFRSWLPAALRASRWRTSGNDTVSSRRCQGDPLNSLALIYDEHRIFFLPIRSIENKSKMEQQGIEARLIKQMNANLNTYQANRPIGRKHRPAK